MTVRVCHPRMVPPRELGGPSGDTACGKRVPTGAQVLQDTRTSTARLISKWQSLSRAAMGRQVWALASYLTGSWFPRLGTVQRRFEGPHKNGDPEPRKGTPAGRYWAIRT